MRNWEYTPLLNFKEIPLKQHFSETTVNVQLQYQCFLSNYIIIIKKSIVKELLLPTGYTPLLQEFS